MIDVSQRVAALTAGGTDERVTSALVVAPGGDRQTVGGSAGGWWNCASRILRSSASGRRVVWPTVYRGGECRSPGVGSLVDGCPGVHGRGDGAGVIDWVAGVPTGVKPEETERRQSIWWFLLLIGFVLLVTESILANRLSQRRYGRSGRSASVRFSPGLQPRGKESKSSGVGPGPGMRVRYDCNGSRKQPARAVDGRDQRGAPPLAPEDGLARCRPGDWGAALILLGSSLGIDARFSPKAILGFRLAALVAVIAIVALWLVQPVAPPGE